MTFPRQVYIQFIYETRSLSICDLEAMRLTIRRQPAKPNSNSCNVSLRFFTFLYVSLRFFTDRPFKKQKNGARLCQDWRMTSYTLLYIWRTPEFKHDRRTSNHKHKWKNQQGFAQAYTPFSSQSQIRKQKENAKQGAYGQRQLSRQ